jgi:hypothetical protein
MIHSLAIYLWSNDSRLGPGYRRFTTSLPDGHRRVLAALRVIL